MDSTVSTVTSDFVATLASQHGTREFHQSGRAESGSTWKASPSQVLPPDPRLCPVCLGMGYTYVELPNGTVVGDTRTNAICRCPTCGEGRQSEYLSRICRLSPEMRGWTFENTRRVAANGAAMDELLRRVREPAWFVTLHGTYGAGKTRLLAATINAAMAAKWPAVYMTTAELLDHLRTAYSPDANVSFDGVWERVTNVKVLALDEMDRWNPSPWAKEKFFELVEYRYRNGRDMLTLFATNASLNTLPPYVASRMEDRRCAVFQMAGPDMRQYA